MQRKVVPFSPFHARIVIRPCTRIERGFDFLGYQFGPEGLNVALKTVEKFVERAIRLYEQEPEEALASARLGLYLRRRVRWAGAGLGFTSGRRILGFGPPCKSRPPALARRSVRNSGTMGLRAGKM